MPVKVPDLDELQRNAAKAVRLDEGGREDEAYQLYLSCVEGIDLVLKTKSLPPENNNELTEARDQYSRRLEELRAVLLRKGNAKVVTVDGSVPRPRGRKNDVVVRTNRHGEKVNETPKQTNPTFQYQIVVPSKEGNEGEERTVNGQPTLKTAKDVVEWFSLESPHNMDGSACYETGTRLQRAAMDHELAGDIERAVAFLSAALPYLREAESEGENANAAKSGKQNILTSAECERAGRIADHTEAKIRMLCTNTFLLNHEAPELIMRDMVSTGRSDAFAEQLSPPPLKGPPQTLTSLPLIPQMATKKSSAVVHEQKSASSEDSGAEYCAGCKQPIGADTPETLFALDRTWHNECFALSVRCGHCGGSFGSDPATAAYRVIENPLTCEKVAYHPACFYQAGTGLIRENANNFVMRHGACSLKVTLPKKFFKRGEIITFQVEIENNSHVKVNSLSIYLEQHTTRTTRRKGLSRKEKTKVRVIGRDKTQLSGKLPSCKESIKDFVGYTIPEIEPTLRGDISFGRQYFLCTTAHVGGIHYDIRNVFEVTILPE